MRLTDLAIKQLPFTTSGQKRYRDDQLKGFGVTVGRSTKTFFVMHGTGRNLVTLGRYPEISLAEARKQAMRVLSQDHPQTREIGTVLPAIQLYLDDCEKKNKPSTIAEYRRMLTLLPDKPLNEVTRHDLPDPTSHRIMAARIFFNWCIKHHLVERNPFNHIPTKIGERDRVLTDNELKAIWQYDHRPFSTILKLLILTGQRRAQIWKLQPEWIDGDLITFPAEIMKGNRPHTIPLSPLALELTNEAPFAFSAWAKNKQRIDQVTGITNWTIHDIRRTHSTISARIGIPLHVEERILDHRTGTISGVSAVYNRHSYLEEMRQALIDYETHLLNLISP